VSIFSAILTSGAFRVRPTRALLLFGGYLALLQVLAYVFTDLLYSSATAKQQLELPPVPPASIPGDAEDFTSVVLENLLAALEVRLSFCCSALASLLYV
jgi:hypothetical protein